MLGLVKLARVTTPVATHRPLRKATGGQTGFGRTRPRQLLPPLCQQLLLSQTGDGWIAVLRVRVAVIALGYWQNAARRPVAWRASTATTRRHPQLVRWSPTKRGHSSPGDGWGSSIVSLWVRWRWRLWHTHCGWHQVPLLGVAERRVALVRVDKGCIWQSWSGHARVQVQQPYITWIKNLLIYLSQRAHKYVCATFTRLFLPAELACSTLSWIFREFSANTCWFRTLTSSWLIMTLKGRRGIPVATYGSSSGMNRTWKIKCDLIFENIALKSKL